MKQMMEQNQSCQILAALPCRIGYARARAGLTQEEVARAVGLRQSSAVDHWEKPVGDRDWRMPTLRHLLEFADLTDLPAMFFVCLDPGAELAAVREALCAMD